nr:histidine kinase [Streptomyces boncukensis]
MSGIWPRIAGASSRRAFDAVLGVALCAGVLFRGFTAERGPGWAIVAGAVLVGGSPALRRAAPLPALAVACAGGVLTTVLAVSEPGLIALGLTGYLAGAVSERNAAVVTGVAAGVALAAGVQIGEAALGTDTAMGPVALIGMTATALAVGNAVRSRRELDLALRERERRRAVEQRMHIARELHDAVGHHIAVINVQSGVAAMHLRSRPEAAEEALAHVGDAARTVLDELAAVLRVLREPADEEAPTRPAPDLSDVEHLVSSVTAAGTRVAWTVRGQPQQLAPAVDLSAYRLIQESLTNASRHGHGVVRLDLAYSPGELCIEVRNAMAQTSGTGPAGAASGYGLIGMSERVAAVGGEFSAGPQRGREFVVVARLPTATRGEGV